jgi:hypothetical protein
MRRADLAIAQSCDLASEVRDCSPTLRPGLPSLLSGKIDHHVIFPPNL